jgi:exocyst complex component 4
MGIRKMLRNLSALRQNLKTITGLPDDSELHQAQAYYSLFGLKPPVR